MNKLILIFFLLLIFKSNLYPNKNNCQLINDKIDEKTRYLATIYTEEIGYDESVYRAIHREMKKNNHYQQIMINLKLLEANKSPLPKEPITYTKYIAEAMSCLPRV